MQHNNQTELGKQQGAGGPRAVAVQAGDWQARRRGSERHPPHSVKSWPMPQEKRQDMSQYIQPGEGKTDD